MTRYFKVLVPSFGGCVAALTSEDPLIYDLICPDGRVSKSTSDMPLQWILAGGHWVEWPDYPDERMDIGL